MRRAATWLLCLSALAIGCAAERGPGDLLAPGQLGIIVVESQLLVGEPLPRIRVHLTQSPTEPYNQSRAGLAGATVVVATSAGRTIRYAGDPASPGIYLPEGHDAGAAPIVDPRTTYALRVIAPDGRVVTAETTTPDRLDIREWVLLDASTLAPLRRLATREDFTVDPDSVYAADANQLVYQEGLLEARFDRGSAVAFQIGILSRDAGSPYVVDADFLSDVDLARLERETASPPFDGAEGFVRLPWYAIFFEGRYDIAIYSVDRNWFDLARSIQILGNANIAFGSNAGDDFERPIFHVKGGIGLFGSAARDGVGFTVHPRP